MNAISANASSGSHGRCRSIWAVLLVATATCVSSAQPRLPAAVDFMPGPVNGVLTHRNGHSLVLYGDPHRRVGDADWVLLTEARRDMVWAAYDLIRKGVKAVAPAKEASWLAQPQAFWDAQIADRYHDYAQQTTRVPTTAVPISREVADGDRIEWQGLTFEVVDAPGYTRGSVAYFATIDGVKMAFTGDLIYGDGQLLDFYSLQDEVPEENIRGYHGYAARLGSLVQSLQRIRDLNPDLLIPGRGPLIRNPRIAIDTLIARVRAVYAEYLSISAGRWYFREAYDGLANRVLGEQTKVNWMPWAERIDEKPPAWIVPIRNSRLILSADGRGFLVDCGYTSIVTRLQELRQTGKLTGLDGLFITHYHDDHTDAVAELVSEFDCPVYACGSLVDILQHPEKYRMPAMTSHPIPDIRAMPDRGTMSWAEFTLTFYEFPGQTIYHDALLVEPKSGDRVMFIGDSFTPSGIDDYCLLNRNLIAESFGYLRCLDILSAVQPPPLLINQHVLEPFSFKARQLAAMRDSLLRRAVLLREVLPWDDVNEGIDERWVQFLPYGQTVQAGEIARLSVRIINHSTHAREYRLHPQLPKGWIVTPETRVVTVPSRTELDVEFSVQTGRDTASGVQVVTLDVCVDEWDLRQWCEAILEVVKPKDGGG